MLLYGHTVQLFTVSITVHWWIFCRLVTQWSLHGNLLDPRKAYISVQVFLIEIIIRWRRMLFAWFEKGDDLSIEKGSEEENSNLDIVRNTLAKDEDFEEYLWKQPIRGQEGMAGGRGWETVGLGSGMIGRGHLPCPLCPPGWTLPPLWPPFWPLFPCIGHGGWADRCSVSWPLTPKVTGRVTAINPCTGPTTCHSMVTPLFSHPNTFKNCK